MTDMTKLVLIIYLTILKIPSSKFQNVESPCPTVFQYGYNQAVGLYGEISILVNPTNFLQLTLQMSIGNAVVDNGKLELARPKDAINNIRNHQPILYYLYFPSWTGIPPKVTKILVNGNPICSGSQIPINLVPIITTVNLQHTLRINVQPLSSSNIPPDNNIIFMMDDPPRVEFSEKRFEFNDRPSSTPKEEPLEGKFFFYSQNREKNRYHFNPTPSNRFNFNPQVNGGVVNTRPSPAEVYRENPFFRNITPVINVRKTPRPNPITARPISPQPYPSFTTINPPKTTSDLPIDFSDDFDFDVVPKNSEQPIRPFDLICGQSITTNHLIYDGHLVPRGAYPWLVAIFHVKTTGLNYICSGSLISKKHVVTAAHCVQTEHRKQGTNELVLILGKLNIQKWIPVVGEKIVEPESIHVHPDYESFTSDADIAVIVLSETLQFTKYIRPVCLWRGDTDLERIVGQLGTVVGWGKDESGVLMTEEPKQTNLPVVSQEKCLASNYQFHYITSNRTFCAGFRNGTGPCNGDSGGGFVIKWDGKWVLRGIVSLSISDTNTKSCDLKNYVVFCDVSKYINWLLSFLK